MENFFRVGERYRNRKGEYEVLQIQGENMKVRYETDGLESVLNMNLQKRIIENMSMEKKSVVNLSRSKTNGTITYRLTLQDIQDGVDLAREKDAINNVFKDILGGGSTGNAFKEVSSIEIIDIKKHYVLIHVNETSTKWHAWVGKKLANDYGRRHLCLTTPDKMFNWERI